MRYNNEREKGISPLKLWNWFRKYIILMLLTQVD